MSSSSVIGAVIERLGTFTFPAGTTGWFDEAPLKFNGVAVLPPYYILQDDGTDVTTEFEGHPWEVTKFRVEVYGVSLAQVDAIALAAKYNGQPISAFAGLDMAASLPLTGLDYKGLVRVREQRFQEAGRDQNDLSVFRCRMSYEASACRTA